MTKILKLKCNTTVFLPAETLATVCPVLTATSLSAGTVILLHDLCYLHQTFPPQSLEVTAGVSKDRPLLLLNTVGNISQLTVASNNAAANKQLWDLNWNHKPHL